MTGEPRPSCEARLWKAGETRRCGQTVATVQWQDSTGVEHTGCANHVDGLKHRYPESLPEYLPSHGTLGLATPWAKDAFGPQDKIEIENLLPAGWTIGVSVTANRAFVILWLNDPGRIERTRWDNHRLRNAVPAARELALLAQTLVAEGPAPESVDPVTMAKAEQDRWAS